MRTPNWPIGHVLVQVEDTSSPIGWALDTIPVGQYVVDAIEDEDPRLQALLDGDPRPLNQYLARRHGNLRVVVQTRGKRNGQWQEPGTTEDPEAGLGGPDLGFADDAASEAGAAGEEAVAPRALIAAHARSGAVCLSARTLREPEAGPGAEGAGPQDG